MENRKHPHFAHLDSLRGLAALAVFFSHCLYTCGLPSFITSIPYQIPIHFLYDGHSAVGLFFVLSGFVLSYKYVTATKVPSLIPFAIQRLFRIYPAFWVALGLSAAVKIWRDSQGNPIGMWGGPMTASDFFDQMLLVWNQHGMRLLKQDWSLEWEVKFSLLIPFLILIAERSTRLLIGFTIAALWLLGMKSFLFHFSLGVLLAVYWEPLIERIQSWPSLRAIPLGLLSLYLYCFRYTPKLGLVFVTDADVHTYINAVGSAGLILFVTARSQVRKILEAKPLAFLGKVSYSFYLVHFTLLLTCTTFLFSLFSNFGEQTATSLVILSQFVLSFALATVIYYSVEKPFSRVGKFFSRLTTKKLAFALSREA